MVTVSALGERREEVIFHDKPEYYKPGQRIADPDEFNDVRKSDKIAGKLESLLMKGDDLAECNREFLEKTAHLSKEGQEALLKNMAEMDALMKNIRRPVLAEALDRKEKEPGKRFAIKPDEDHV